MHNSLGITRRLHPEVSPFHTRPYLVIHAGRFREALAGAITDEVVRRLAEAPFGVIGSTSQWADGFDIDAAQWWELLRGIYRKTIDSKTASS